MSVLSSEPAHHRTDRPTLAFGLFAGAVAAYHLFKVPPVLPVLTAAFGYGRAYSGALMSVYSVAGLLLSWAAGRACARRGARAPLAAGFAALAGGGILGLLVPDSPAAFLGSRLLEGAGFAVIAVAGGVVTTTSAPPNRRAMASAVWATWMPVGQIAASAAAFGFVGAGRWGGLWWVGLALAAVGAGWAWVLGRTARPGFAPSGGTARSRPRREGGRWELGLSATLFGLWSLQFVSFMTWLPPYLVEVLGLAPQRAALVYLLPPPFIIVFNLLGGVALRAGWGVTRVLLACIGVQAAVWWSAPWASGGVGIALLTAYGITSGVIPTCLFALPVSFKRARIDPSHALGALMTGRNLGVLVGPVLLGELVALPNGWRVAPAAFGGLCAAALMVVALLAPRIASGTRR